MTDGGKKDRCEFWFEVAIGKLCLKVAARVRIGTPDSGDSNRRSPLTDWGKKKIIKNYTTWKSYVPVRYEEGKKDQRTMNPDRDGAMRYLGRVDVM